MCGTILKNVSEMTEVNITHAWRSVVNYPRNGQYQVCKTCENKLLKLLNAYDDNDENKEE
jgi:hypothetical protein